jgi:hypothetical protein
MKPVRGSIALGFTLATLSACVVENNPPPPLPALAVRSPVVVAPPAVPGAPDAGTTPDGSGPPESVVPPVVPPASAPTVAAAPAPAFLACTADADCVAVPRNGCCHNGFQEAVNASSVAAYQASFVCPEQHPICPMFRIRDDRVPVCNATSHQCELVKR